ncbi:MAG: hypothetical protein IJ916_01895 [Paludibacteraceae bacterium]|nr:hypothetical protein [Paludibacteraceae bacterium]
MNIKSKRTARSYACIGVILFLGILLFAVLLFLLLDKDLIFSLLLIIPICLIVRWMLIYYKAIPSVTITNTEIILDYLVKSKRISIDDVCEFQLTDSFPISRWILNGVTNGFSIRTKADEEYIFYERFYKNPHELRARFAQITNMNFVPRDSAIDNPFTSLTSPLSFKLNIIIFLVGLALLLLSSRLEVLSLGFIILLTLSLTCLGGSISSIYVDLRDCLTIEVDGKEIRFKYRFLSRKVITANLNDIITSNISLMNIHNGYSGTAFCYITPDYRRIIIKESNLKSEVLDELIDILDNNGVPVTNFKFEC